MEMMIMAMKLLGPALMAILGYLGGKLVKYINGKHKIEYAKGILDRLNESALEVVKFVYMAYVGPLKKSGKKLSAHEKAVAKQMALEELKSYYGMKGLKELAKVLGLDSEQLDKKLERSVEAKVYEAKHG